VLSGEAILTGKVFVSCGQHLPEEREAAQQVCALLRKEFDLSPYLAINVQSLDDVMIITKELRSSDYFLFIDFNRLSLFTHQELTLAHHLGFAGEVIALRQTGEGDPQGFLRYVLSNPVPFSATDELIEQVRKLVRDKGWNRSYSRNLALNPALNRSGGVPYGDHTGLSFHESWRGRIENHRPDVAAVGTVCILDSILYPSGDRRHIGCSSINVPMAKTCWAACRSEILTV
jgi:hypothetical protein